MSSFTRDGHTFDVGASIFEVLAPLVRVFAALGTTLADELDLTACDPAFKVALRDGQRIRSLPSSDGIVEALGRISAEDARLEPLRAVLLAAVRGAARHVYVEPVSTVADLALVLRKQPALARYLPALLGSYQAVLARFFTARAAVLRLPGADHLACHRSCCLACTRSCPTVSCADRTIHGVGCLASPGRCSASGNATA